MNERLRILLHYGSIGGISFFGGFLLLYLLGFNPIGELTMLFSWIPFVVIYLAMKKLREEVGMGYIHYFEAFRSGMFVAFITGSLFGMLQYLFGMAIDGAYIADFIETSSSRMEMIRGLFSDEWVNTIKEELSKLTVGSQAYSEFQSKFIFGVFVSLILAFFVKRNPEAKA